MVFTLFALLPPEEKYEIDMLPAAPPPDVPVPPEESLILMADMEWLFALLPAEPVYETEMLPAAPPLVV